MDDEPCGNRHGGQGACGGGGGNCKCQRQNQRDRDPKSAEYHALAKSIATLTKNVSVMATHMSGKSDKDNDAKPAADEKMASNAKNSALCKTPKKEKEWWQTLSDGCVTLRSNICPIVTVKSLDSSLNS